MGAVARAVVVGAGLGGLAGAIALRRRGWSVTVLERRPDPAEVGAGIALWPNGLRALDALGVGGAVRDAGLVEVSGGVRTASGRWLSRIDVAELRRRQGDGVVVVDRPALHAVLRDAAPAVVADAAVRRVEPGDATRPAVVHDARGEAHPADLVVAADGLRSTVRGAFWPAAAPRPTGQTAFRLVAAHDLAADGPVGGESWGRGEYVGLAPLPGGRTYLYAGAPTDRVPASARTDPAAARDWLRERFAGWHDPIPSVLAAAGPEVLVHPLEDLRAPASWCHGRVVLLGDAAHAMTPNLGQGATQAFLDAVVLAEAATEDPADLRGYERRRRPTALSVARRSRRAGAVAGWSSRAAVAVRDTLAAAVPASATLAALDRMLGPASTTEPAAGGAR